MNHVSAVAVYDAAQRLEVPSLSGSLEAFLNEAMHPTTVCSILKQGLQFKVDEMVNTCLMYIKKR